jgi:uncharacterized protein (DUF885 family)
VTADPDGAARGTGRAHSHRRPPPTHRRVHCAPGRWRATHSPAGELGYLTAAGARMGYLDAQLMRAIRVIIDIGMHLELPVASDWAPGAGQRWTPELALEFFVSHSGRERDVLASEVVRYLGAPGQAISYKLGERAWLAGRDAAKAAHAARGESFDLKSWHMAALLLGSLGLDDLADELAQL